MDTIDDLLKDGISAHRKGDLKEATRLYQQVLNIDTGHINAHHNPGHAPEQPQWPSAINQPRTALQLDPRMSMAHNNLGQILAATGQPEEGLLHLEEAVKYNPDNVTAWDNIAHIRLQIGHYEASESAATHALKLRPLDAHLLTRLGAALAAQKRFSEALNYFQQALTLDRDHQEAWTQLGITLFLRNDLGNARNALQTAISLDDTDVNALRHLALVKLSMGNSNGAVAQLERLLGLQPDDHQSRLDLAIILLSAKEGDTALAHLNMIAPECRDDSKFLFYQALALQQTGHASAAREILNELSALGNDTYSEKARTMITGA